jgi:phage regulator Rha-like protein
MNQLIEMNGQMTMGTKEIAKLLERDHSDIRRSAKRLVDSGVINGGQPLADTPYTNDQNGQTYYEYRLNKLDSITLVAQNSPQFTAALVKRWDELERGVAKPAMVAQSAINDALAIAEVAARMLNMSNSSKLGMLQKVERQYGVPSILPSYAVDAPSDAADGSSRVTVSLTELLKLNDVKLSAQAAYKALQSAGIVERRARPSTGGTEKEFWALTTKGLLYGKNITSPSNPRQVQPHFYETKASAILAIISSK